MLEQLRHSLTNGPMEAADAQTVFHQRRMTVAGQKVDQQFDQISEFQRFVVGVLDSGNIPAGHPEAGGDLWPWRPEVQHLAAVINDEPFVRMYAAQMMQQVPAVRRHFTSVTMLLDAINYVTHTAPIFRDTSSISWQFPLSAIMNFAMMTDAGKLLMRRPQFNDAMNEIMAAWCVYLDSPESRYVLNEDQYGWLSPPALEYNEVLTDYVVPDRDAPYWGWKSYNDFFHRMVKMEMRPIDDPHTNETINSPNDGVAWALENFVQRDDAFWLKSQVYSMGNLLNQDPEYVNKFVGGTVYQTYVNGGADWHGFSSPINGKVTKVEMIRGYAWTESDTVGPDPMSGPYSQGWAAGVATRGLIYIDSGDSILGTVCVIPIGLTEVSSLESFVKEGQMVKKGDVLGQFSFGGSSFAIAFQPGAIKEILVKPPLTGRNDQPIDTLKANQKCAIANLAGDSEYVFD